MRTCIIFLIFIVIGCDAAKRPSLSAPRRVSARVLSPYSVQVRWRDSKVRSRISDGRRYLLRYRSAIQQTGVDGNATDILEPLKLTVTEASHEKIIRISKKRAKLHGLLPSTTYNIDVKVTKGKRWSAWSKVIEVTTFKEETDESMVRNVTATAVSSTSVELSWLPPLNEDGVTGYTIVTQSTNGRARQKKAKVASNVTSHLVKSLRPNQLYVFRIQSMKVLGPHPMSRPVMAKPLSARPSGSPHSLKLVAVNSSLVLVSWKPPNQRARNGQLTSYKIAYKRKKSRRAYTKIVSIGKKPKAFELRDVEPNTTYKIRVAAQNINGTGPYTKWKFVYVKSAETNETKNHTPMASTDIGKSDPSTDRSPSAPSGIKVVNKTGSTIHLSWLKPATPKCCPLIAYKIAIRNVNDSTERELVKGSPHVIVAGLYPNTRFEVNVTALNTVGESKPSTPFYVSTKGFTPPLVTDIQAPTVNLGGSVNLTCEAKGRELPTIEWYIQSAGGLISIVDITQTNLSISKRALVTSNVKGHDLKRSTLILHQVTQTAEREYTCKAKNSVGTDQRKVFLAVNEPPKIMWSRGAEVVEGLSAHLACEARGKPLPVIKWADQSFTSIMEHDPPKTSDRIYARSTTKNRTSTLTRLSYLEFSRANRNDSGKYYCVARSKSGEVYAEVKFEILGPLPPPVSKIQTIALSPSRVSVTWLPPLNYSYSIQSYQVSYRKVGDTAPARYKTVTRVGTDLYGLENNTDYLVGVIATTDKGLGERGPEVKVTTLTNERLEPINVIAQAINETMIRVTWDGPRHVSSMYIRGYHIYIRREGEQIEEQRYVSRSEAQQFLLGGMEPNIVYELRISTLMTWGFEASSSSIKLSSQTTESVPPARPRGVRANADSNGIIVSWLSPVEGAPVEGYLVIYSPASDLQFVERIQVPGSSSRVHLDKVKPLTEYTVNVRAFNRFGESLSYQVRAKTPSFAPSKVRHALTLPVSPTEIHIKWMAPSRGHVTRYHIRYWRPGRREKQSAWMTGNFRNYVAGSLRKGSMYRFEIIPYNTAIPGDSVVMFATTPGDTPDGPPLNISLTALNSSTLLASWQPPDPDLANGKVKGYRLVLKIKGGKRISSFRQNGSKRNFTFYNVDTSMTHQLRIGAITTNGTGVMSPWIDSTYFGNPDKPGPPENLVIKPDVTTIQVSWSRPGFTGSQVTGYIVGYGQFIPEAFRVVLPGTRETYRITGLRPKSRYIVSVRAFNTIGESQPNFRKVRTHRVPPAKAPLLAPTKLTVQSDSPSSLMFTWLDPAIKEKEQMLDGRTYLIRYSPMSGESYTYKESGDHRFYLTDLEPGTSYELSVKTVRGNSTSEWSLPIVNSTQQTTPSSAPQNVTVLPSQGNPTEILVTWRHPKHPNGNIEEYFVYQSRNPTLSSKSWKVTATKQMRVKIRGVKPYTTYYFRLQARNRVGYGPLSKATVYRPVADSTAAPSNVSVSGLDDKASTARVRVTWQPPQINSNGIIGYEIYYSTSGRGETINRAMVNSVADLQAEISGLEFGKTYIFKIRSRYLTGSGPFSDIVTFSTQRTAPLPETSSQPGLEGMRHELETSQSHQLTTQNLTLDRQDPKTTAGSGMSIVTSTVTPKQVQEDGEKKEEKDTEEQDKEEGDKKEQDKEEGVRKELDKEEGDRKEQDKEEGDRKEQDKEEKTDIIKDRRKEEKDQDDSEPVKDKLNESDMTPKDEFHHNSSIDTEKEPHKDILIVESTHSPSIENHHKNLGATPGDSHDGDEDSRTTSEYSIVKDNIDLKGTTPGGVTAAMSERREDIRKLPEPEASYPSSVESSSAEGGKVSVENSFSSGEGKNRTK